MFPLWFGLLKKLLRTQTNAVCVPNVAFQSD